MVTKEHARNAASCKKGFLREALFRVMLAVVLACGCLPGSWLVPVAHAAVHENLAQAEQRNDTGSSSGDSPAVLSAQAEKEGKAKDKDGSSSSAGDDAQAQQEAQDQKAVDALVKLIEKLPSAANVKPSDADAVNEAQKAYDDLTPAQKQKFDSEEKESKERLGEIVQALAQKIADKEVADGVVALIQALPDPGAATVADRAAADAAQAALAALTPDQLANVSAADQEKLAQVLAAVSAAEAAEAEKSKSSSSSQASEEPPASTSSAAASEEPPASSSSTTASEEPPTSSSSSQESEEPPTSSSTTAASEEPPTSSSTTTASEEPPSSSSSAASEEEPSSSSSAEPSTSSSASSKPSSSSTASGSSNKKSKCYVSVLLVKWDEPDEFGERHFVGDGPIVEEGYKSIDIAEFGKTVQLTGWYASTDGTGAIYQTADSGTDIGSFDLKWKSSDEKVASVSPSGLVTPRGKNGTVKITATVADKNVYQDKPPSTSVVINFSGQEGKCVKQVDILDADGNVIGERWGGVTVYDKENAFHQLHARVTWHDVATGEDTVVETGAGDDYKEKRVDTTVRWGVSTSTAFTINEDTGRLRTGAYSGNAYVTCTVVGGADGKDVTDTANVQLDTGVYEYNPAASLALKVVYEERPDEVVKEATYTYEELLGMLGTRHVNATVVNATQFGTISADGFLFKDVVNLVAVDDADVLMYRFTTADGYDNPVSYQYLFESGPRYYFPNYDLGGSQAGGEIVPPLLAYSSAMEWGRSQVNPSAKLDDGNRFRLVFGCLASGDANTSFQIYYINAVTVVLKGAPSAGGDGGSGEGGDGGSEPSGASSASSEPGEQGSASASSKTGSGERQEQRDDEGESSSSSSASDDARQPVGARSSSADEEAAQAARETPPEEKPAEQEKAEEEDAGKAEDVLADGTDIDSTKRWRVYQMMNKTNSDVPDWDDENPLSPFALPVAIGTFAVGAGATGVGFRRRLK